MLAVALALVASCCWGLSDFGGGLASRRLPAAAVVASMELVGLALSALLVAFSADPLPAPAEIGGALLAGVSGLAGLLAFYRALAIGTMSIVAPIAATGVTLPLVVGLASGDRVGAARAVGLAVTVTGVLLASREPRTDAAFVRARGVGLALLAAAGFGGYFIGAHVGARGGVAWLLLLSHAVALPLLAGVLRSHGGSALRRRDVPLLAAIGLFDFGATGLYGIANRHGLLSVVAVVGSLYPVVTLLLARHFLSERMARPQAVGVALALAGVALVAAG